MDVDVCIAFGKVLRRLRKASHLTQEQLGFEAGLQRKHVSALELAEKQPSLSTVFRLAKSLAVSPGHFIALVDEERTRAG